MTDERKRARSVARAPAFDAVRVELAVVVIVAVGALLVVLRMDWPKWLELIGMAAVGIGCGGWIAGRARQAADRAADGGDGDES